MSKIARTHTNLSNRAKAKENLERKAVFKSVLDNPFRIHWPSIPVNVQNSLLARLITVMDGMSAYRHGKNAQLRIQKRSKHPRSEPTVEAGRMEPGVETPQVVPGIESEPLETIGASLAPVRGAEDVSLRDTLPSILDHVTIGINEVTRKLEAQVKMYRQTVVLSSNSPGDPQAKSEYSTMLAVVFVCRADIDSPILVDHLPHLIAACNAAWITSQRKNDLHVIKLVTLPKHSEHALSAATGLRRAAVLAIDSEAPELSSFASFLESVPTVSAAWLKPQLTATTSADRFMPTHVKQLRTSAPKDMKSAKEHRVKARAAAKEKGKVDGVARGTRRKIVVSIPE